MFVRLFAAYQISLQMKNRYFSKILLVLICIILTACTPPTPPTAEDTPTPEITPTVAQTRVTRITIGDGGFLSEEPCGPPCFLGMTPDVTSYEEAVQILKDYQYYDNFCQELDIHGSWLISCTDKYDSRFLLQVDNNKVYVIEIGFAPQTEITMQEVVDRYGEPSYVNVGVQGYEDTRKSMVRIYFPDLQLGLWPEEYQAGGSYTIQPTTIIGWVLYYGAHDESIFLADKRDWVGYDVAYGPKPFR